MAGKKQAELILTARRFGAQDPLPGLRREATASSSCSESSESGQGR